MMRQFVESTGKQNISQWGKLLSKTLSILGPSEDLDDLFPIKIVMTMKGDIYHLGGGGEPRVVKYKLSPSEEPADVPSKIVMTMPHICNMPVTAEEGWLTSAQFGSTA